MKLSLSLQLNSPRFGVPYNPLDIPSMGEWFDYRSVASVGDGNPASSFAGKKGLYTATASGTERPTYVADSGDGRGALMFDGVNDKLSFYATNANLYGPDGNFEIWWVVKIPAAITAGSNFWNSGFGTGTSIALVDNPTSNRWYFGVGGQTSYGNTQGTHDDAWHVLRLVINSSGNQWYVDGVSIGANVFGSFTWNSGSVLANIGGDGNWTGSLRHLMTFKAPLDATTAADLTSYLQAA